MTCHLTTSLPLCSYYSQPLLCLSEWISVSHFFSHRPFLSQELLLSNSCQLFVKASQQVRKDECLQNMRPLMGHRKNNTKIQLVLSSMLVSNQQLNIQRHHHTVHHSMYQLMCHELTKDTKILRHSYVLLLFINEDTKMSGGKKAIRCHTASKWSKS